MLFSRFVVKTTLSIAAVTAPVLPALADDMRDDRTVYSAEAGESMMTVADKMADPATQDRVANVIEGVTAAIMDMPIGQFAEAIESAAPGTVKRDIRRGDTVADLAGRDGRHVSQELGARSQQIMGNVGEMTRVFAAMLPEFERLGREMAGRVGQVERNRH